MAIRLRFLWILLAAGAVLSGCGGGGGSSSGGGGQLPTATTGNATGISTSGAVLNGVVNPNGTATDAWFEYGTAPDLSDNAATAVQAVGSGGTDAAVSETLASLAVGTSYYFRVCASNSSGTACGSIGNFTTDPPAVLPTVSTSDATDIFADNAVLNGTVNPNGAATTAWFRYGTDPDLAGSATTSAGSVGSGSSAVPVSVPVSGFADNTTCYFRLEAQNGSSGVITGPIRSFRNDAFVDGTVGARSKLLFFNGSNQLKGTVTNYGDAASAFSLTVPSHFYKVVSVTNVDNTSERAWTMQDAAGNNLFRLSGGADVGFGAPVSYSDAYGTVTFDPTGTGYTAGVQTAIYVVGVWDTEVTILTSTDSKWVPGSVYPTLDNIVAQTGNRIDKYSPWIGSNVIGTINGDLIVFANTFAIGFWTNYYREYGTVNGTADRFTGTSEQSGTDGSASYLVTSSLAGVKRP